MTTTTETLNETKRRESRMATDLLICVAQIEDLLDQLHLTAAALSAHEVSDTDAADRFDDIGDRLEVVTMKLKAKAGRRL
jgi:hypothetical protein